jgi:hypothetical protein
MLAEQQVAGINEDTSVTFPLSQDEFRELVERQMTNRKMQQYLQEAPGGSLIELMRQRGMLKGV